MFYNYKILNTNNEEILYLYVSSIYEFSSELNKENKPTSLLHKVNDYINAMDIKFDGKKVMLVVNDIIIANLTLDQNFINYKEMIDLDKKDNIDIIDYEDEIKDFIRDELKTYSEHIISNFIKMRNKDGKTSYVDLNNYIVNLLTRIIPPTYEEEALKSAAIIVRTNVFRALYENNYVEEEEYQNINTFQKMWKNQFWANFDKLKDAVEETSYQYLSNKNQYYFDFNIRDKYQVPFSSYGANMLAKSGYKYRDILNHYYPDATLEIV